MEDISQIDDIEALTSNFSAIVPSGIVAENLERAFFDRVEEQLDKVNSFYLEQQEYLMEETNNVVDAANKLLQQPTFTRRARKVGILFFCFSFLFFVHFLPPSYDSISTYTSRVIYSQNMLKHTHTHTTQEMLRIIRELYRGLQLLKNYRILNFTGFLKILKKHDKNSVVDSQMLLVPSIMHRPFYTHPQLQSLIEKAEELAATFTNKDDVDKELKANSVKIRPVVSFRLGTLCGLNFAQIVVLLFLTQVIPDVNSSNYFFAPFPIFRALILICLHLWLWGGTMWVFKQTRVNHSFIFQADPRSTLNFVQVLEVAAWLTLLVLTAFNVYLFSWSKSDANNNVSYFDNSGYIHFSVFFGLLVVLLMPFNLFHKKSRYFLLGMIGQAFSAPFAVVDFKSFWFADQMTSLVRVIVDLGYAVCFYTTGDFETNDRSCTTRMRIPQYVLVFVPFIIRLVQCLRRYSDSPDLSHALNCGKYTSAIFVTFFAVMAKEYPSVQPAWIVAACFGTMYSYSWDILKDWSLLQGSKYGHLRKKLTLSPGWYYFAMVSNLFLRIAWIMSISPDELGITLNSQFLLLLIGALEVYRRSQWNYFRIENEHLNNVGKFRAVNIVPLDLGVVSEDADDDTIEENKHLIPRDANGSLSLTRVPAVSFLFYFILFNYLFISVSVS